MSKVALVLSGGGAKGAFQAAAEKYAREVRGYRWDVISGVSVGALNGAMLSMGAYDRVERLWKTVRKKDVMTGGEGLLGFARLLCRPSIHGHAPLKHLIAREIDPGALRTPFVFGAVSLASGEYVTFRENAEDLGKALLASTAIPVIFPPVRSYPGADGPLVDGGIRNVTPVGDALAFGPDEVVIVNCSPRHLGRREGRYRKGADVAERTIEIMSNEIFLNDVDAFLRINRLIAEVEDAGTFLRKSDGTPYQAYRSTIIEPEEPIGGTLDFSRETLDRSWEAGWEAAKKVLG